MLPRHPIVPHIFVISMHSNQGAVTPSLPCSPPFPALSSLRAGTQPLASAHKAQNGANLDQGFRECPVNKHVTKGGSHLWGALQVPSTLVSTHLVFNSSHPHNSLGDDIIAPSKDTTGQAIASFFPGQKNSPSTGWPDVPAVGF